MSISAIRALCVMKTVEDCSPDDLAWLQEAYRIGTYSDDPSTRNGAVIVKEVAGSLTAIGQGYNQLLPGMPKTVWDDRQEKYKSIVHAEECAVQDNAKGPYSVSTRGATMYCPWYACMERCVYQIIGAGITRVVGHWDFVTPDGVTYRNDRWDLLPAFALMNKCGLETVMIQGTLGVRPLISGKWYDL